MQLAKNTSKDKMRGGFYTPAPLTNFILKWAINGSDSYKILEPSCGDGAFLAELKNGSFNYKSVTAIELDIKEANKARKQGLPNCDVIAMDFHRFCSKTKSKFDLVIGNPPFIRYQFFDKDQQKEAAKIFEKADLKYSKLTNSWVSFVVGSSLLLNKSGKIGFVVPAEILQVSFAKTLRQFLAHFYNKVSIISFKELVFEKIQQEVIVLLCERDQTANHNIEHIEVNNLAELASLDISRVKTPQKRINFHSNKWTSYFLDQNEIDFIEDIKTSSAFKPIGALATAQVGITTGANPFFTVSSSTINHYQIKQYSKPLVGRSAQISSAILTHNDWKRNLNADRKASLIVFPPLAELKDDKGALSYIEHGKKNGIHKGYKCRIREEWQIVPSLWKPDAFFLRRSNDYPKMLANEAGAYCTDTMHRIKLDPETDLYAFIASYYNSISLAFTEIAGRSHGGGVLELMPNELKSVVLPYKKTHSELLPTIDDMLRANTSIRDILSETNNIILEKSIGLSKSDIRLAHSIWEKLSLRRLQRGKKPTQIESLASL